MMVLILYSAGILLKMKKYTKSLGGSDPSYFGPLFVP